MANAKNNSSFIQSLKIIAVLVVICLVCGILLALCNDLLYITDEEKFNRAMRKVYPQFENDTSFDGTLNASFKTNATYGEVLKVYRSTDDAYVLEVKGTGGFSGGNVTLYVAIGNEANRPIKAWTVTANQGQSFMANISETHQKTWYIGNSIADPIELGNNKVSGTTLTSTAINNAMNMAAYYCVNALKLVSTPESEATDAIKALLGATADGYSFAPVVDADYATALTVETDVLSFYFTATKDGADTLGAYVYGNSDNGHKVVIVKEGLTHAERLESSAVVASTEGIDAAYITTVQQNGYFEYQIKQLHSGFEYAGEGTLNADFAENATYGKVEKVFTSTDGAVVVQATGTGGWDSGTITINVVIKDGTILGWNIVSHVGQSFLDNIFTTPGYQQWYQGASISGAIELGNNLANGTGGTAPFTSEAINNAINMAAYYVRSING